MFIYEAEGCLLQEPVIGFSHRLGSVPVQIPKPNFEPAGAFRLKK